jgi:hypothetical protein
MIVDNKQALMAFRSHAEMVGASRRQLRTGGTPMARQSEMTGRLFLRNIIVSMACHDLGGSTDCPDWRAIP